MAISNGLSAIIYQQLAFNDWVEVTGYQLLAISNWLTANTQLLAISLGSAIGYQLLNISDWLSAIGYQQLFIGDLQYTDYQ